MLPVIKVHPSLARSRQGTATDACRPALAVRVATWFASPFRRAQRISCPANRSLRAATSFRLKDNRLRRSQTFLVGGVALTLDYSGLCWIRGQSHDLSRGLHRRLASSIKVPWSNLFGILLDKQHLPALSREFRILTETYDSPPNLRHATAVFQCGNHAH